jgi:hypothetical protein
MIASDHRVCLDGLTPPFRASPKTPNIGSWTSKNFWEKLLAKFLAGLF